MFGFKDSYNSSSSSNSNNTFNNKILFINFNNIIKTESSKPKSTTAKPTTAKPTTAKHTTAKHTTAKHTTTKPTTAKHTTAKPTTAKHTTAKPTTAKPTTAKHTTAKPANPNIYKSSNVSRSLLIHNNNNENTKAFISALKKLYKTYISTTAIMKCEPFLTYATNLGIFTAIDPQTQLVRKQNLMTVQQDIHELMTNITKYLLKYYKCNIGIYSSKVKLKTVNIIDNIIKNDNTCNFILYYLFGNLFTSKLTQIYHNTTQPDNNRFNYTLQIDLQIKFENITDANIVFNNTTDLINEFNKINNKAEILELVPNDMLTFREQNKTELPISICGKYIIISLIHEKFEIKNGIMTQKKIPIIITDITQDLNINRKQYEFIGASEHRGDTPKKGHYVSYIKKTHKGELNYYLYDDSRVTKIDNMEELTNNINKTYRILIYKCKDDNFYMNSARYAKPIKKLFDNNKHDINDISNKVNSKLIGSINYGSSCYFNSLLALLMHIPEFVYLILNYDTIPTLLKSITNR